MLPFRDMLCHLIVVSSDFMSAVQLSSIPKLHDVKGVRYDVTLQHFVAEHMVDHCLEDVNLLRALWEELKQVMS